MDCSGCKFPDRRQEQLGIPYQHAGYHVKQSVDRDRLQSGTTEIRGCAGNQPKCKTDDSQSMTWIPCVSAHEDHVNSQHTVGSRIRRNSQHSSCFDHKLRSPVQICLPYTVWGNLPADFNLKTDSNRCYAFLEKRRPHDT